MKWIAVLLIIFAVSKSEIEGKVEEPCETKETKCHMTETKAYIKCLEKQRVKRSLCPYGPSIIQPYAVQCNTPNCENSVLLDNCINTCSGSCNGYDCQDRCDRSCRNDITVQSSPNIAERVNDRGATIISPNVTTTIHLTNIVNNTNHINVPTSINNTNINNLDLTTNSSAFQQHAAANNHKCCVVVQPKVCENLNGTNGGRRCVHKRHHTCGQQCASATIHAQVRQPCEGTPEECPPYVVYVPQPQPRCSYTSSWPYVSCGNANIQGETNCDGCYDHYGYGFQNFHTGSAPDCQGCYDDGFGQGSMYRQGPYYRPGYYHMPPVEMPAYTAPVSCGTAGCFGNQMIDPAFGMASCSPYAGGCSPSSQYYNTVENYAPLLMNASPPQQYVAPMQQYYPSPPQYYPSLPQYYPSPPQYYPSPPQYYPPMQQFYPSYQQPIYDQNFQFYGQQIPSLFNPGMFDNLFNKTLLNETTTTFLETESVIDEVSDPNSNAIVPLRLSPIIRWPRHTGYPREYLSYPSYSPFPDPFLRRITRHKNVTKSTLTDES